MCLHAIMVTMTSSAQRRRPNAAQAVRRAQTRRFPVVWVVIGGIVVLGIVGIVAVALSGGSKKSSDNGVAQVRPVRVEGAALPTFDSGSSTDPAIGTTPPTVVGENFAGKRVTIGNDGRAKAIVFVAHWCPHCQREVPRIANYLKAKGLPQGVDLYIVPTSTDPALPNYPPSTWLQREGLGTVPTLVDDGQGSAFTAYGGSSFPYFVFIGKDGKVAARLAGEIDEAALPSLFDALAAGRPIPGTKQGASSGSPTS
jgi:cytochrome c biogenesis protein CcmG/thiol:disulfide interchange protein DsbE